jgi:predicted NUDIX family phosphoesterase
MKTEFIPSYPDMDLIQHLIRRAHVIFGLTEKAIIFAPNDDGTNALHQCADMFSGLDHVATFSRREELEDKDCRRIHPIPYILIENEDQDIYTYQRGKESGEGRLAGNDSIGVGGHPEDVDAVVGATELGWYDEFYHSKKFWDKFSRDVQAIVSAVVREGNEEVSIVPEAPYGYDDVKDRIKLTYLGAMHDETDEVGKVHLAVVFKLTVPNFMKVFSREKLIIDRGFISRADLKAKHAAGELKLENWSKLLIDHLDTPVEGVPVHLSNEH